MARLCVLTQDPALGGGVLTKLREFLHYAGTRGHVCDLYFPLEWAGETTAERGLESLPALGTVHAVPGPGSLPHHLRAAAFARRCRLADGYDAHHLISGQLWQGLPLVRARRRFIASIACTFAAELRGLGRTAGRHHLLYNPLAGALMRRQEALCARVARLVLADSRHSAREIARELGVAPGKLAVLPAPVDSDAFHPGEPLTAPCRYVLSVGRLDRRKDVPTLLAAFALVAGRVPDVELRIVGEGRERAALAERIARLGAAAARVRLVGAVGDDELRRQYRGASVFALASRQEGIGIVLLEALASGLPIVATDCGGTTDAVEPGRTGALVPVGDAPAMARWLEIVLTNGKLAAAMARAARAKAMREFRREVVNSGMDRIYRRVFGIGGDAGRRGDVAAA